MLVSQWWISRAVKTVGHSEAKINIDPKRTIIPCHSTQLAKNGLSAHTVLATTPPANIAMAADLKRRSFMIGFLSTCCIGIDATE